MGLFDALVEDIKSRFSLGSQAVPLIQELLRQILAPPGGIEGFLDKFRVPGLASQASSWLGKPDSGAIAPHAMEQALGATVPMIAQRLGLKSAIVASALGYATPKMIGLLTPGGVIPTSIPASILSFLDAPAISPPPRANRSMFRRVDAPPRRGGLPGEDTAGINRWIFPGAATILAIAFVAHFVSNRAEPPVVAQSPPAQPTQATAETEPAPAPAPTGEAASFSLARLSLSNSDGEIAYSGAVADDSTRQSILDSLKTAFGADKLTGNVAIDSHISAAAWAPHLPAILAALKTPGSRVQFQGNAVTVGGTISDADRGKILARLKSVLGDQFQFEYFPGDAVSPSAGGTNRSH